MADRGAVDGQFQVWKVTVATAGPSPQGVQQAGCGAELGGPPVREPVIVEDDVSVVERVSGAVAVAETAGGVRVDADAVVAVEVVPVDVAAVQRAGEAV